METNPINQSTNQLIALMALFFFVPFSVFAFEIPVNDGYVTDAAGLLTTQQEIALEQVLQAEADATSNEIAILIVQSLEGESIVDVAVDTLREWGVGTAENNGIVMVFSYEDRKIFISPGHGLEGALPDIVIGGIMDADMTPRFKDGEYYEGFVAGVDSIRKHIAGEYTVERYSDSPSSDAIPFLFFFGFMVLQGLTALFARTKSWWLGGVIGAMFGALLGLIFSWWSAVPLLTVVGFFFDYLVSKHPPRGGGRGGRGLWIGGMGGRSRRSGAGGFRGFGGGTGGGAGAGRSW